MGSNLLPIYAKFTVENICVAGVTFLQSTSRYIPIFWYALCNKDCNKDTDDSCLVIVKNIPELLNVRTKFTSSENTRDIYNNY